MQRACTLRLVDRTSTVLANQLPQVSGSVAGPVDVSAIDAGQGQHVWTNMVMVMYIGRAVYIHIPFHNSPAISSGVNMGTG